MQSQEGNKGSFKMDFKLDPKLFEQARSIKPVVAPQDSKKYFLPTGYQMACEWAFQKYSEAQGLLPIIGKKGEEASNRTEKITPEEIQTVQNLIEKCLQLYMNQSEVSTALDLQANVNPQFTTWVWEKLEEQNPNFFTAYNVRLRIKEQITAFNYLVSQQAQLMQKNGYFRTQQQQQQQQQQQHQQQQPQQTPQPPQAKAAAFPPAVGDLERHNNPNPTLVNPQMPPPPPPTKETKGKGKKRTGQKKQQAGGGSPRSKKNSKKQEALPTPASNTLGFTVVDSPPPNATNVQDLGI